VEPMGLFRTTIQIASLEQPRGGSAVTDVLVDTRSEYTWAPREVLESLDIVVRRKQAFLLADGQRVERDIGYALVRAGGSEAPDLVVFAQPGDMLLLGVHSLEGLNLQVDPVRKELVPAGPVFAAAAA